MKKRLISLLVYSVFWLIFFVFARLFFIAFQYRLSLAQDAGGLAGTFLHGLKLDISTTAYFLLLPFLLVLPGLYFSGRWFGYFMKVYTWALIILCSVIVVSDASLYGYWGFRMDYTPLFYLKTPGEAVASVTTMKLILLLSAVTLIAALFIFLYNRFVHSRFSGYDRVRPLITGIITFLILTAALIIPVRGGVGIAPVNAGSVYFSSNMYLNHTAVNAVWNVGTTAFTHKPVENPYVFYDAAFVKAVSDSLYASGGEKTRQVIKPGKPNIVLIILESFSSYIFGPQGGDSLVTPRLNRIAREGILFRNFYASGTRTDKAMPAILSGYPAQPVQSIIKEPKKSQTLPNLVRTLNENGYNSAFWYGGDINFANFNSYILGSGFNTVVTVDDFESSVNTSKWGVHDHYLFEALRDSMIQAREPFINVVLTLSSHEPYDVPMKPVFPLNEIRADYRNSVFYTDSVVGAFIDWAKLQDWWNNTVVILLADHGARWTEEIPAYSTMVFRIPMVMTGGALLESRMIVERTSGQTDLPLTILRQIGIDADFPFSKDMFSDSTGSFAFYTFNDGFGFITDSSAAAWDHRADKVVWTSGPGHGAAAKAGKAYLQYLFDDYLGR